MNHCFVVSKGVIPSHKRPRNYLFSFGRNLVDCPLSPYSIAYLFNLLNDYGCLLLEEVGFYSDVWMDGKTLYAYTNACE